jgi:hypothetical protein
MKKYLAPAALTLVLAIVGIYVQSAWVFSDSATNRFLDELEDLSLRGKAHEYCAKLHDNMQVSIHDHSGDPPADFSGNKKNFCDYVSYAAKGMDLLGISTQVQRHEFTVRRNWLHPWTAEVTYSESRTTRMSKLNVTVRTEGEDQWTLVQTLDGIKALRLTSKTRLAE